MTDRAGAGVVLDCAALYAGKTYARQDVTSYVRDWIIEELHRQGIGDLRVPTDALPWLVEQLLHNRTVRDRQADRLVKYERKAAKRKRRKAKRQAAAQRRYYEASRHKVPGAYAPEGTGRKP